MAQEGGYDGWLQRQLAKWASAGGVVPPGAVRIAGWAARSAGVEPPTLEALREALEMFMDLPADVPLAGAPAPAGATHHGASSHADDPPPPVREFARCRTKLRSATGMHHQIVHAVIAVMYVARNAPV